MISFEELIQDNGFIKWALKKEGSDKLYWDKLYDSASGKEKKIFNEAVEVVNSLHSIDINENIQEQSEDKIEQGLIDLHSKVDGVHKGKVRYLRFLKYAASIIILIGLGTVFKNSFTDKGILEDHLELAEAGYSGISIEDGSGVLYKLPDVEQNWQSDNGLAISVSGSSASISQSESLKDKIKETFKFHVPARKVFKVTMPDGTIVNLNANSDFEYSIDDASKKRISKLKGEGLFEVTHNKERPFIVETERMNIEVLGTIFNVMAYEDEHSTETTLVQGSVKVGNTHGDSKVIKPGDVAIVNEGEVISVIEADVDKALDWMDNSIILQNDRLEDILTQLGRWYGVSFVYDNEKLKNVTLSGELSKEKELSDLLKKLKYIQDISFIVSDKNVKVISEN